MTTRIVIENTGPNDVGVSPLHPYDPLYGTRTGSVRVRAHSKVECYVHAGQSLIINEINRDERAEHAHQ